MMFAKKSDGLFNPRDHFLAILLMVQEGSLCDGLSKLHLSPSTTTETTQEARLDLRVLPCKSTFPTLPQGDSLSI